MKVIRWVIRLRRLLDRYICSQIEVDGSTYKKDDWVNWEG